MAVRAVGQDMKHAASPAAKALQSEVFCDFLELVDGFALAAWKRTNHILKAMIKMILDQGLFRLANGFLDRLQLLGNIEATATVFDHVDYAAQMPFGPFQPFDDVRMGAVEVCCLIHPLTLSPWRGYDKPINLTSSHCPVR